MAQLICYCCGHEILTNSFALVSMKGDGNDRMFLFLPEHVKRVDDAQTVVYVERRPNGID